MVKIEVHFMGNNNNWQVQAPSINLYALDGMYKDRNIIPTGKDTLVGMLQSAWKKGKEALQEDFKNNVIGNTDSAEITKAKAQGMTTNQYLQNQVSNKGWLMDYIADPLSNSGVQTAAKDLDKDELAKYKKYLLQQTYDKYVTDRTGATTDAVADIQKTLNLTRPVNERSSLLHDAIYNIGRGTAERLINPNDPLLMELNKQLILDGKQPILGEDIMHSPERLLQALRGMDKSEGTKLFDTDAAREGLYSLFTKGPNEAKSRAAEILGTGDRFANAVQYTREATEMMNAFKAQFSNSNLAELTPEIYNTWAQNYIRSIGLDPNSELAKNAIAGPDAIVKQSVNSQYRAKLQNYFNLLNSKKVDTATLSAKNKAQQEIYDFQLKWGNKLDPSITQLYNHIKETDDMATQLYNASMAEKEAERASKLGGALTVPVPSALVSNYKTEPRTSALFNAVRGDLVKLVQANPDLQKLGITDDDYDTVTYNLINQASTHTTAMFDYAIKNGVDIRNPKGDIVSAWRKVFNSDTFPRLEGWHMNPKAALLFLGIQHAQNKR